MQKNNTHENLEGCWLLLMLVLLRLRRLRSSFLGTEVGRERLSGSLVLVITGSGLKLWCERSMTGFVMEVCVSWRRTRWFTWFRILVWIFSRSWADGWSRPFTSCPASRAFRTLTMWDTKNVKKLSMASNPTKRRV